MGVRSRKGQTLGLTRGGDESGSRSLLHMGLEPDWLFS